MRVLIIKTSSMGDVIHTLPALTDAAKHIPNISFDWVVEENFTDIPKWHPNVKNVIPIALRRWRKNILSKKTVSEFKTFYETLRSQSYDYVIDAQGLLKSAFIALLAKGKRAGFDWSSVREPSASLFYQQKVVSTRKQHAIIRARTLFADTLGYKILELIPDYGIDRSKFVNSTTHPYLVFLHATTWKTKHWPLAYWQTLAKKAIDMGFNVKLPWGTTAEYERARAIANGLPNVEVLPKLNLTEVATVLAGADKIIAVDTGLGHLAAALDVPTISLYGPTDPILTGALGRSQTHLQVNYPCAPCLTRECSKSTDKEPVCFSTLPPDVVWKLISDN